MTCSLTYFVNGFTRFLYENFNCFPIFTVQISDPKKYGILMFQLILGSFFGSPQYASCFKSHLNFFQNFVQESNILREACQGFNTNQRRGDLHASLCGAHCLQSWIQFGHHWKHALHKFHGGDGGVNDRKIQESFLCNVRPL